MTVKKASGIILLFLLRSTLCIPLSEFYKRHIPYSAGGLENGHKSDHEILLDQPCYFYGTEEWDIIVSCLIVYSYMRIYLATPFHISYDI